MQGGLVKPLGRVGGLSALVFCLATAGGATAPTSSAAGYQNQLFGVAALSPADVWAVGIHCSGGCGAEPQRQPLIMHWGGTAWSKVKIHGLGSAGGAIDAVSAFSPRDIWAAGYSDIPTSRYTQPLTLHWNGTAWSVVASPTGAGLLNGVSAVSATSAWAVGDTENPDATAGTLTMRWNGTNWSMISSPDPGPFGYTNELRSVAASSPKNAWAVGYYTSPSGSTRQRLILHWNGTTTWSRSTSPSPGTDDYLHAVTARTTADAWAVGDDQSRTGSLDTLILHWDGTRWSRVSSPNATSAFNSSVRRDHEVTSGCTHTNGTDRPAAADMRCLRFARLRAAAGALPPRAQAVAP